MIECSIQLVKYRDVKALRTTIDHLVIETEPLLSGFATPQKRLLPVSAWIVARRETLLAESPRCGRIK